MCFEFHNFLGTMQIFFESFEDFVSLELYLKGEDRDPYLRMLVGVGWGWGVGPCHITS